MERLPRSRISIVLASAAALVGCYEGIDPEDWYANTSLGTSFDESGGEAGDGAMDSTSGDPTSGNPTTTTDGGGDGDGDDDGDPDPTTTTSGDGDDGDGDPTTSTTGDGDGDGDPTTTGDGDGDPQPLPDNPYCNPVANWNPQWIEWEFEVLDLVNQARAQGGNCGSAGSFPPSAPLTWHPALTCAARVHSKDMNDSNYFDHTNLQGNGPGWRLGQAGYDGGGWGENIAAGYGDPVSVVQGWLDSDGHCSNMLNPGFSLIGIGYVFGNGEWGHYWTQTFGS